MSQQYIRIGDRAYLFPEVKKPKLMDYYSFHPYDQFLLAKYNEKKSIYNNRLSSSIEISPELKEVWKMGEVKTEGVHFVIKERWKPLNQDEGKRVYEVLNFASPLTNNSHDRQ